MPTYLFHLHERGEIYEDHEGIDLPGLWQAMEYATAAARDIMCAEVSQGRLCLSGQIVIEDERHAEVMRVPFRDVVMVSGL